MSKSESLSSKRPTLRSQLFLKMSKMSNQLVSRQCSLDLKKKKGGGGGREEMFMSSRMHQLSPLPLAGPLQPKLSEQATRRECHHDNSA